MSALARYFVGQGKRVCGYDKTPSAITTALQELGISIHFEDTVKAVPNNLIKEETLVIFTPAIPSNHKGFHYLKEQGFRIKKRAEVIGNVDQR